MVPLAACCPALSCDWLRAERGVSGCVMSKRDESLSREREREREREINRE